MMKSPVLASVFALGLGLGGCAEVQKFESFYTSPTNQATIALLETQALVLVCDISAVSNLVSQVASAAQADASFIGTTGKVYAASSAACTGFGGLVKGSATAPAGALVVQ